MSTPTATVESDLKAALKAGDKERVAALRLLLNAVKNERIRRQAEVDEAAFLALVRKEIKVCQEAAQSFRAGGRTEMAAKEEREAALLEGYLPEQASEEEIRKAIEELVAERGLSGPADIGPVMKEMVARFAGRAEGATIQRLARDVLK